MSRKSLFLLIPFLVLLALPVWAAPQVPAPPVPVRYVNDLAGMLEPGAAAEMEAVARALQRATGAELALVTVNDLDGYPIEDYALELFRRWGLGDKKENTGLLLLVNKENALSGQRGRVRIEVGYGLEGTIPDGKAGRILDEYVLPFWSQKDYSQGIYQGFMALGALVAGAYEIDLQSTEGLQSLADYQQNT
ncbi:MAG TPA: TPM domain-containing protein, partial [Clostridia bacterium]|nr:TPM domain-containing protein [Clostridia bacterium]